MLNIDTLSHFIRDNNLIEKEDRIVLGVSGGADSICLLHTLNELKKALEIRLFVVHINHGIRGEEASRDENYVREFCKKLNVEFFSFHYSIPKVADMLKISEEEAGRKARYESFENVSKDISKIEKIDISKIKIAVAHNKNDTAETVLHNLTRGSGISGLKGILAKNGRIIRPLLSFTRDEIEEYLDKNKIKYMTDSTNLENEYTRNILRNKVFPILAKHVNNNVINNFYKSAIVANEADRYFEDSAQKFCEKNLKNTNKSGYRLNKSKLMKNPHILGTYIIRYALKEILKDKNSGIKDIGMVHIEDIWQLAKGETGKRLDLKYDIRVYNDYEHLRFVESDEEKENESNLPEIRYSVFSDFNMRDIPGEGNIKWLDFDKVLRDIVKYTGRSLCVNSTVGKDNILKFIEENIKVRECWSSDFIRIKSGKKAIKKLFTDEKIPASIRKKHILLAIGSEVIWIFKGDDSLDYTVGLDRISELYKVDLYTNKVLKIEVIK